MRCGAQHTKDFHQAGGRVGGSVGGRKSFELYGNPATPEGRVKGGRIGGRMGNREGKARGGRNQPREAKVRGGRNQPREAKVRGGCIGGRKNVESGHIQALGRKNVESGYIQALGRSGIGGRIGGRKAVESGQLARISKGVPSTADGILFRSQTEALFYCVFQELGGEPVYEPYVIELDDGTSYMPDFVLGNPVLNIPANVPIELKPTRNAYYNGNVEKAIRAESVVVYWDEFVER